MINSTITRLNIEWSDYCIMNYDNPLVVKCMSENLNQYIKVNNTIYKVVLDSKDNFYIFDNAIYMFPKSGLKYETITDNKVKYSI